ncbi:hypothetical protein X777_13300 [Ooceraea biroi]|uniref:Uncharacterized protein n=1 Tax=Ooceraea biroi TaxID=2015173 RepID=A0A026WW27_OOCBI|nr:hypothetical protein X777_13300 [Ooceraea biroi]
MHSRVGIQDVQDKGVQVRARDVILDNVRLSVHGKSPKCVRRTQLHAEGRTLRSSVVMIFREFIIEVTY